MPMRNSPARFAPLPLIVLLLAACAPGPDGVSPPPAATFAIGAGAERTAAATTAAVALAPDCSPGDGTATDLAGWSLGASADATIMPIIASSLLSVGPVRFLYAVADPTYRQLAAPERASRVAFYALERDPQTPVASVEGTYLSAGLDRGLYRAAVTFDCAGEWGADIAIDLADGTTSSQRVRFEVRPEDSTPGIGEAAPRSDSPTASTLEEVRRISTDAQPYAAAYTSSVAQAVTAGRPSLIFFATPAFCQSGFCGPTMELVKQVAREYAEDVTLVNVEPYELQETVDGLRPRLDADGHLQPVPAALDYGIPVEPYLFVVDAAGDVFARFEGVVGADELRAALEDVIAAQPVATPSSAMSPDHAEETP